MSARGSAADRIGEAEEWMQHAFGTSFHERLGDEARPHRRIGRAVKDTVRILNLAGTADLLESWAREDRRGPQGRKAIVSLNAALGILLLQMLIDGKLLVDVMNRTVDGLSRNQREALGLWGFNPKDAQSYDRIWRAMDRLQLLLDEFSDERNPHRRRRITRRLGKGAYAEVLATRDEVAAQRRRDRLRQLSDALLDATFAMLPPRIQECYAGNTALDATFLPVPGKIGNSSKDPIKKRRTATPDAGWYQPHGDHLGDDTSLAKLWGLEAEIITMVANRPGEDEPFPLLFLRTLTHRPGSIAGAARALYSSFLGAGYKAGHLMADLAYLPNSDPTDLQVWLHENGFTPVFDYRVDQAGVQATIPEADAILVDGSVYPWYLTDDLQNLDKNRKQEIKNAQARLRQFKAGTIDPKTRQRRFPTKAEVRAAEEQRMVEIAAVEAKYDALRAGRKDWRMLPKGGRRPNGTYQYMNPNPAKTLVTNPLTGEVIEPITKATVVIEPSLDMYKYMQKYPYREKQWLRWYGLRSVVEGQNNFLKRPTKTDLAQAMNRLTRGVTFASIASTLAMVAANVSKIVTFVKRLAARTKITSKNAHQANSYWPAEVIPATPAPPPE